MKNLMETNIYDVGENVLICGTCLPNMESVAFNRIKDEYDTILFLCLESEHINMAITKICGMISTKKIKKLTFASVNRSPHCTQLHYIKHEIERVMKITPIIKNIIIQNNEIYEIDDNTIMLSKDLISLSNIKKA